MSSCQTQTFMPEDKNFSLVLALREVKQDIEETLTRKDDSKKPLNKSNRNAWSVMMLILSNEHFEQ